ncbi:hypothetical protein M569_07858, partial [Genlisea aurea]
MMGLSFFWLWFVSQPVSQALKGTLYIDGAAPPIATVDEDFICATMDWWPPTKCDYGTCSWGNASLLNLDLTSSLLVNAVKAFSPLKLRLGGTLQDNVRYQTADDDSSTPCNEFVSNSSEMFGFTSGCLSLSRWDELNNFFKKTGANVVFGLNGLAGRHIGSDGTCTGAWDPTNALSLIRHTVDNGYPVHGWELGNELSGRGTGARVAADQYASDVIILHRSLQDIYKRYENKPLVLGPGGFFDSAWFASFTKAASNTLQAVTHHVYNLGPGVDEHLVNKILDPSYLDGGAEAFKNLQNILKSNSDSTVAWVGEAGGAYNSGHNLVSNAFVSSFWYLDQLGMASLYDTKTYCRQTLIGGNYGLLNTTTFVPNPDYYSALLWHRLMGRQVLSTSFTGTKKIRVYTHCSKSTGGITVLLMNLDNTTAVDVDLSVGNGVADQSFAQLRIRESDATENKLMREEYHLSAKDGDLHSQTVILNGEEIHVINSSEIPHLKPKLVEPWDPLTVAPLSIVFAQIPTIKVPAC